MLNKKISVCMVALAFAGSAVANTCPQISTYRVMSFSEHEQPLKMVVEKLLQDTAWKLDAVGGDGPNISLRNVSGSVEGILNRTVSMAASQSQWGVFAKLDAEKCTVRLSLTEPAKLEKMAVKSDFESILKGSPGAVALAAIVPPKPTSVTLSSGKMLSEAMRESLSGMGWELRWNIKDDYLIDVDIPAPASTPEAFVTYLFRAYQSQGGLMGVVPRFAAGNRVVVIEPMSVR